MTDIQMEYGPRWGPDTGTETPWMGKGASMVTQDVIGKYAELVRRGYVFSITTALTGQSAMAAANVSPLAAGTGQPIVGVYTPVGSNFDTVILRAAIWNVSGTPGAGAFGWNVVQGPISQTGTRGASHLTGSLSSDAVGLLNQATTGSQAGVAIGGFGPSNFAAALAASAGPLLYEEDINGLYWAAPGVAVGLAAPAAGTTWVVGATLTWAEIPRAAP